MSADDRQNVVQFLCAGLTAIPNQEPPANKPPFPWGAHTRGRTGNLREFVCVGPTAVCGLNALTKRSPPHGQTTWEAELENNREGPEAESGSSAERFNKPIVCQLGLDSLRCRRADVVGLQRIDGLENRERGPEPDRRGNARTRD
jgi:hypothetical protein